MNEFWMNSFFFSRKCLLVFCMIMMQTQRYSLMIKEKSRNRFVFTEKLLCSHFPLILSSPLSFSPALSSSPLLSSHGGGEVRGRCVGWGAPMGTTQSVIHLMRPRVCEKHIQRRLTRPVTVTVRSLQAAVPSCVCENELFKDPGEEWDVLSRFQGNRWAARAFQILPLNWSWRMDGWIGKSGWRWMIWTGPLCHLIPLQSTTSRCMHR